MAAEFFIGGSPSAVLYVDSRLEESLTSTVHLDYIWQAIKHSAGGRAWLMIENGHYGTMEV